MTILTTIQQAAASCNLPTPTAVVSSTDDNIKQMLTFAAKEGDESASSFDWRNLINGLVITGDGQTTLFQLPADFERFPLNQALFSSAIPTLQLYGPIAGQDLLLLKSRPVGLVRPVWRLIGGSIEIWPALAAGVTVTTEYLSTHWILSVDGYTRQSTFTNDGDRTLIPERVVQLGVIWRWKASKGLEYAEDFRTWDQERARLAGHDHGNKTVRMSAYGMQFNESTWFPGIVTPI